MVLKIGGLFSGVGGIEFGYQKAGFDISWGNEIDTKACVTYKLNHKHEYNSLIFKEILFMFNLIF